MGGYDEPNCGANEAPEAAPAILGNGVTVARLALNQLVQVQILDPQFDPSPEAFEASLNCHLGASPIRAEAQSIRC